MPAWRHTIEHLDQLVNEIGPRGATTLREARAAGYTGQVLEAAGLEPRLQTFRARSSATRPYLVWTALALASLALFWLAGRPGLVIGLILIVAGTVLLYLEVSLWPNPLRSLPPKKLSQNIHTIIQPLDDKRRQVVLVANLDSGRLPLPFSAERWLALLTFLVGLALVALFALALVAPDANWRWLALTLAVVVLGQLSLALLAGRTAFSPGANDNASGVAVLLSTAERLAEEPLQNTAVRIVFTGCRTVGGCGAEEFVVAHRGELDGALWLTVEGVGGPGSGAGYVTDEALLPVIRGDPGLVAQAEAVAEQRPDLDIGPVQLRGVFTESVVAGRHGLRLLTVTSRQTPDRGAKPESWHLDISATVNPETLERNEAFVWALLKAVDEQAIIDHEGMIEAEFEEEE